MSYREKQPALNTPEFGFIEPGSFLNALAAAESQIDQPEELQKYAAELNEKLENEIARAAYFLVHGMMRHTADNHEERGSFYGNIDAIYVEKYKDEYWLMARMGNFEQHEAKNIVLSSRPGYESYLLLDDTDTEELDISKWLPLAEKHPDNPAGILWAASEVFAGKQMTAELHEEFKLIEETLLMRYDIGVNDDIFVSGRNAYCGDGWTMIPRDITFKSKPKNYRGIFMGIALYEPADNIKNKSTLCMVIMQDDESIVLQPCKKITTLTAG